MENLEKKNIPRHKSLEIRERVRASPSYLPSDCGINVVRLREPYVARLFQRLARLKGEASTARPNVAASAGGGRRRKT